MAVRSVKLAVESQVKSGPLDKKIRMNLRPTHSRSIYSIYRRYIRYIGDKLKQKQSHARVSLDAEISTEISVPDRYIGNISSIFFDILAIFPSNDCRRSISCRWVPISDISAIYRRYIGRYIGNFHPCLRLTHWL